MIKCQLFYPLDRTGFILFGRVLWATSYSCWNSRWRG